MSPITRAHLAGVQIIPGLPHTILHAGRDACEPTSPSRPPDIFILRLYRQGAELVSMAVREQLQPNHWPASQYQNQAVLPLSVYHKDGTCYVLFYLRENCPLLSQLHLFKTRHNRCSCMNSSGVPESVVGIDGGAALQAYQLGIAHARSVLTCIFITGSKLPVEIGNMTSHWTDFEFVIFLNSYIIQPHCLKSHFVPVYSVMFQTVQFIFAGLRKLSFLFPAFSNLS